MRDDSDDVAVDVVQLALGPNRRLNVLGHSDLKQGCQMAKFDPFAPPRPPPWRNPRKVRDQVWQLSIAEP